MTRPSWLSARRRRAPFGQPSKAVALAANQHLWDIAQSTVTGRH